MFTKEKRLERRIRKLTKRLDRFTKRLSKTSPAAYRDVISTIVNSVQPTDENYRVRGETMFRIHPETGECYDYLVHFQNHEPISKLVHFLEAYKITNEGFLSDLENEQIDQLINLVDGKSYYWPEE